MPYEEALASVNMMQDGLAGIARAVITALKDGRVSLSEGVGLSMRAMPFIAGMITIIQAGNTNEILYVLEHGDWVLEENPMLGAAELPSGK